MPLAMRIASSRVAGPDHGQHRAEDFFLRDAGCRAEHRRRCAGRRRSLRLGQRADIDRQRNADLRVCPSSMYCSTRGRAPRRRSPVRRSCRDLRPGRSSGCRGARRAGRETCRSTASSTIDPRAGRALLPLIAERTADDAEHGFVEIGVVVDDDRVLASHLGDHALHPAIARGGDFGRPGVDRQADRARAGEGDQRDVGMLDQARRRPLRPCRAGSSARPAAVPELAKDLHQFSRR